MFKSRVFVIIQYVFFIVASAWLVKYCFNKIDVNSFYITLIKGNYWMAFWVFLFSVLVYISRIIRWQIILNKVDIKIGFMNNFSAVAVGYLVSFIFPRGGEVVKCAVLKKTNDLSLHKSISSIFFERIIDSLCLLLLVFSLFILEILSKSYLILGWVKPEDFLKGNKIWIIVFIGLLGLITLVYFYRKFKHQNNWLITFLNNIKLMFALLSNWKFLAHTLFIWISYFLMTYLWFFVFDQTSSLTFLQSFQIMIVGVIARSLPLPGGAVGAYHLAVAYALTTMNIDKETALGLAFIIHGFQTIFTVFAGIIGIIWLFVFDKSYRIK
ncbi:MAG: lysylphosphatidylglycerol synthase transmembrane domain-containing protein [Bacteroidia bacterium]